ncbi:type IV secretory system conjugative DNA transfer family protein [Maritalea sp.]|uniref:type IV secretory system conjugative DNA transfer family protein n=1 Tax=Maritalea sp. TaxID=2003361 RepID=UPI003F4AD4D1
MVFDNESNRFGSASWATEREIREAGLLGRQGMQIGYIGQSPLRLETDAPRLSIAGAGAGKMRDLLSMAVAEAASERNFILDPRGEIASVTMVNFAMAGSHAYCWNPVGMHGLPQHAMQPLDILKLESPQFHADCKIILESLIPISGSASGKYFELRAQEWGGAFMKMLVERDGEVSFPSLYRTTNAIESNTGEWPDILEFMLGSSMESVRRCAGEMLAKQQDSAREFGAIVGELYAYLSFLDDPMLQAALEKPRASLSATCNPSQAATWFLNVPVEYVSIWAPVLRTMFTVQMLYKSRAPSSPPVNMIIDEAGQLGSFDALLRAYTFGRGAGVRAWALFQDAGQIKRNFGPTGLQGFMGSAALRQFFGVRDYETAQFVSSMLGQETLEYDDTLRQAQARQAKRQAAMSILTGNDPFSAAQNLRHNAFLETHRTKQARSLMTSDEILAMPEDRQICFVSGKSLSPMLGHKYPYYQRPEFAGRFLPNPYHSPFDSVSIPRRWGTSQAKVITETVPRKFVDFPQYDAGSWSYINGYRPR